MRNKRLNVWQGKFPRTIELYGEILEKNQHVPKNQESVNLESYKNKYGSEKNDRVNRSIYKKTVVTRNGIY